MNYKDLKNGEVIKIIDYTIGEESTTISIFNKVEQGTNLGDKIYTYADLDMDYDYFSVEKNSPNAYYIANYYGFELATEEEKNKLYESLFVLYTKECDINKHFTDSNYYEIEDFLFDKFCIKVEEYDDDLLYPKFVDDVVKYIWCRCCEVLGMTSGFEEESTDTLVSLEETIKYFEPILKTYCSSECLIELMNGYINKITGVDKSDFEKHIEHMLNDDWEGDEEIFVPQDECSKPFNTPKILGCIDNLGNNIVVGSFMEKKYNIWEIEGYVGNNDYDNPNDYNIHKEIIADNFFTKEDIIELFCKKYKKYRTVVVGKCEIIDKI